MASQRKKANKFAYEVSYKMLPNAMIFTCMYQYKDVKNQVTDSSLSDAKKIHISGKKLK